MKVNSVEYIISVINIIILLSEVNLLTYPFKKLLQSYVCVKRNEHYYFRLLECSIFAFLELYKKHRIQDKT